MARRQVDYLYRRGATWWLRLQPPGEPVYCRSLGTTDRLQAEVLAGPAIQAHKRKRLEAAGRRGGRLVVPEIDWEYPLGLSVRDDGTHIRADTQVATLTAPDGRVWQDQNSQIVRITAYHVRPNDPAAPIPLPAPKPAAPDPSADLALLETYLAKQTRPEHYVRDARRSWARWLEFVENRPLSRCTRADGHAFVAHLRAMTPPPAPVTVRKWLSHIKAPIADGLPKHDPRQDIFHNVLGTVEVQTKRLPLSEADMTLFRETALPKLADEERLLWLLMATTGMRPSECAAVTEEFEEGGVRYIMIGVTRSGKTATSARRIPIPDAVIRDPAMPARIAGPLFGKNHVITGKNLLRAMRRIGITDPRKVVYSLRHRAHDRLRAARCPREVALQIVGHDEVTVHDGYGSGHPVAELKEWIERIGY
ncbi:hypothetical protein [Methylobacterium sp. 1030]|uniref:hypothetical protein n=1 Tax=Methylobacterium sp. 1030 TaxID=3156404 RepID=UPI003399A1B0